MGKEIDDFDLLEIVRMKSDEIPSPVKKETTSVEEFSQLPPVEKSVGNTPQECLLDPEDQGEDIEDFVTPSIDDPDLTWEKVQAQEEKVLSEAFKALQKHLRRSKLGYRLAESPPYTLQIEDVKVQVIIGSWRKDARAKVFKGIRIICPEDLNIRKDAFRRKKKSGSFNFEGLMERLISRLNQIRESLQEQKENEKNQSRMEALQKQELLDLPIPRILNVSRHLDGTYEASLRCPQMTLADVKALIKFATRICK